MFNFSYTGRKDPRLSCLNFKNLSFLRQCGRAIREAPSRYCGVTHSLQQIRKGLESALHNYNSREFKYWKEQYQQQQIILKRYRWWASSQQNLIKAETWDNFAKHIAPLKLNAFKQLHSNFELHKTWAHYSSEALYQVAFRILPHLENYFEFLQLEFSYYESQVDAAVIADLKHFLRCWHEWHQQTQISLTHAMVAKLSISSSRRQLSCDDVINELYSQLNLLGTTKEDLPVASQGLTAQHISAFQEYIARGYSKKVLYQIKYQVSWLCPDQYYALHTQYKTLYIVPKTIIYLIPASIFSRWWQKLWGQFDLEHYCIEHQHLFACCRMLEKHLMTESGEQDFTTIIQTLTQTLSSINDELNTLNYIPSFLKRCLSFNKLKKHHALLQHWQHQINMLMNKSIYLLNRLMNTLEINQQKPEIIDSIQHLLKNIKFLKQLGALSSYHQAYFTSLSKRYETLYSKSHPEISLFERLFQKLSEANLPGNGSLTPLYDYLGNLKLTDVNYFKKLQDKQSIVRRNLCQLLINSLDKQSSNSLNHESLQQFIRALTFIRLFGMEQDLQQLSNAAHKLLEHYITVVTHETEPTLTWLQATEAMLLITSQQLNLQATHDKITYLRNLRIHSYYEFRAACALQLSELDLNKMRAQTLDAINRYETTIWSLLSKQFNECNLKNLDRILLPAYALHQASINLHSLSVSQRTVLNITILGKPTNYWLEQLLWLKTQPITQLKQIDLQSLQQTCERRAAVLLCCLNHFTQCKQKSIFENHHFKESPCPLTAN